MCKIRTTNCTALHAAFFISQIEVAKTEVDCKGEMACVALTSLISTFELEFLQSPPRVSLQHDDHEAAINFFLANLYCLQAILQENSSGALKDLEIQTRDFALRAEDDIEIQLSNILLTEDRECREKASHELHQTLRAAAQNATELLKIITREKKPCVSAREMASVALTILITKFRHYFLEPFPMVDLGYEAAIRSSLEKLSYLQACLLQLGKSYGGGGAAAAIRKLETKIRIFSLKAVDDIEMQLSNFLLAKGTDHEEAASQELHQALQEAAKIAAELSETTKKEGQLEMERQGTCSLLFSLWAEIEVIMNSLHDIAGLKFDLLENLSSLEVLLWDESSGGGATTQDLNTKIGNFAHKAKDDIQIQHGIFKDETSWGLHQALQEATEKSRELLKIITKEKEYHQSARQMASDALNIFMKNFHFDFLHPTPIVLLDEKAAMISFFEKLSSLQAFLQKESSVGADINDLGTKIRDFVLKAEDDIETQVKILIQAKDDIEYQEKVSQLNQTLQEAARNAEELLKIINSRSNEVVDEANETQPWNVESNGSLQRFPKLQDRMVGRHHDYTVIRDQLIPSHHRPSCKIIFIVGMVGIGKTILAKNVYEDMSIASHFEVRGWVTVPQDYNKSQMVSKLLQSIKPGEPNVIKKGSTPGELQMQVWKCLHGRRYLIVLDNILSKQALIDIRECVPNDINGSCILLTSSHYNRGWYAGHYIHHMTLLDPNESWDLFCNICSIKKHMAPEFEKIRNHVVEKCDGLPELIVEVAKRLSKCNNIQQRWKKIEKELESLGILDRNALTVSYNPLPHHLKLCFLYVGVFPKRNKVLVKMLTRLWIAEGFVKPWEHKEFEGQAYGYLEELVDRSLLLIENRSSNGKIKICRMHSALHSFCVGEAQKEGILCAVNTLQHSGLSLGTFENSCRWLSLYSHSFDYYVLFRTNIPRSIFIFHENPEMFVRLKLLRVMAFDTCIFLQRVPVHLGDLIYLRYLSITQWFEDMDNVVSNNPNLQTLVVSGNGAPIVHLPSSIWDARQLRHLELGNSYTVDPPSMIKENLQSLSLVMRSIHCRKEVYDKLPNLKKLKIFLNDDIEACHSRGSCSNPITLDYLDYLKELENLTISVWIDSGVALAESSMFPTRLKKLRLSGINLSERDLTVIGMLPCLIVLKLENAIHGTLWKVPKRGFRSLRFLLLEDTKLKQWEWEWETCDDYDYDDDDFPVLEHMVLRFCYSLKQIPEIFTHTYTLELIVLEECHPSLVTSAHCIQSQYEEYCYRTFEIKILGPEYDESQSIDTDVSIEDDSKLSE